MKLNKCYELEEHGEFYSQYFGIGNEFLHQRKIYQQFVLNLYKIER